MAFMKNNFIKGTGETERAKPLSSHGTNNLSGEKAVRIPIIKDIQVSQRPLQILCIFNYSKLSAVKLAVKWSDHYRVLW